MTGKISRGRQPFKTGVGWGGVGWGGVGWGGIGFEEQCLLLIITRRILDILYSAKHKMETCQRATA